jgi:hypothetical protein
MQPFGLLSDNRYSSDDPRFALNYAGGGVTGETPTNADAIGRLAYGLTNVGGVQDAAGLLGGPSLRENVSGGNYLDAALQGVGVLPVVGGVAKGLLGAGAMYKAAKMGAPEIKAALDPSMTRVFAGKLARTADLSALEKAEGLFQGGAEPGSVLTQTGWLKGAENKPRFEISDHTADLTPWAKEQLEAGKIVGGPLSDAFIHPELFKAYPHLADLPVSLEYGRWHSPSGGYDPKTGTIDFRTDTFDGPNSPKSILLHEIQHAIQHKEGFANGGSPSAFNQQDDALLARDILQVRKEVERAFDENPDLKNNWTAGVNHVLNQYNDMDALDLFPGPYVQRMAADYQTNPSNALEKLRDVYGLDRRTSPYSGREVYDRLAGENEASNVQTRMNLTPSQRLSAQNRPWLTSRFPVSEQIVLPPIRQ